MWPILLSFLHFTVFRIFLASLILYNTTSFCIRLVKLSSASFSCTTFKYSDLHIRNVQFSALQKDFVGCWWKKTFFSLNAAFAMEILDVNAQTKSCVICCHAMQIVPLTDSLLLRYSFSQLHFRYRESFFLILLAAVNIIYFITQLMSPLRTFFLRRRAPARAMASFLRFVDHTQRFTRVGRTPLDEWLASVGELAVPTHPR
jgi:hypothetical protein